MLLVLLLTMLLLPASASAQRGRTPPPVPTNPATRGQQQPPRPDTGRVQFMWMSPDSVMSSLMARRGYRKIEYQGGSVFFDAATRLLRLVGDPSAVRRDETMLIGDTIIYNDSTKRVLALGDTVVLRDPTQEGSDDVVVRGSLDYDLETRFGRTGAFSTSVV
jgi:hypothetical protein